MEEILIYTQHYANSITEVYITEDNKTVIQKNVFIPHVGNTDTILGSIWRKKWLVIDKLENKLIKLTMFWI